MGSSLLKAMCIGFFWIMVIHNLSISSSPIDNNNFTELQFGLLDPWCFSWLLFTYACYIQKRKNKIYISRILHSLWMLSTSEFYNITFVPQINYNQNFSIDNERNGIAIWKFIPDFETLTKLSVKRNLSLLQSDIHWNPLHQNDSYLDTD